MKKSLTLIIVSLLMVHTVAFSQIIFSKNAGAINSGSTLDIMLYDIDNESTHLLQKGTVKKRGEYNAVVSPNGKDIVFNTYKFGGWKLGIGVFNEDGIQNVRKLTDRNNYEYEASFSWDGSQIAYLDFDWGTRKVSIYRADQKGKNSILFYKADHDLWTPQWTPDNSEIVYTSNEDSTYSLNKRNISTNKVTKITSNLSNQFAHSIGKAAHKLAYLSDEEGAINLYTINLDGSEKVNLTKSLKSDRFTMNGYENSGCWTMKTCWSPDGKKIVCTLPYKGNMELFIVNADGSAIKQITNNQDTDMSPFWIGPDH